MSRGISAVLQRGPRPMPGAYFSYETSTAAGGGAAWTNTGTNKRKTITLTLVTSGGVCPVRLYLPYKGALTTTLTGSFTGAITPTVRRNYLEANLLAGGGGETWTWVVSWLPG